MRCAVSAIAKLSPPDPKILASPRLVAVAPDSALSANANGRAALTIAGSAAASPTFLKGSRLPTGLGGNKKVGRWPTRYKPDRLIEALEQSQAKYSHLADFFKFF
jgi:hypothetical protein